MPAMKAPAKRRYLAPCDVLVDTEPIKTPTKCIKAVPKRKQKNQQKAW